MNANLAQLIEDGWITKLDMVAVETWARVGGEDRPEVLAVCALASRAVSIGHACLDLDHVEALSDAETSELPADLILGAEAWQARLATSPLVSSAGPDGALTEGEVRPLVVDSRGRLYLRRYWDHQQRLAWGIHRRLPSRFPVDVDTACLEAGLDRLFGPEAPDSNPDLQRLAAEGAVRSRFFLISGGPGTGKTSTVAKILALLVEQAACSEMESLRMCLLAPTGKAAAHLGASIARALETLDCDPETIAAIPTEASTVHRALGAGGPPTRYRYDAASPLPVDVVLVDEASMVDLALMSRLIEALPPEARLILLGDRDQLASVEAGAVLGDIAGAGAVSGESGVETAMVQLVRSHRFDDESVLGELVRAVHAGEEEAVLELLENPSKPAVRRIEPEESEALQRELAKGYAPFASAVDASTRLSALERYRVLCAHRHGPSGFLTLNQRVESILAEQGVIRPGEDPWYEGRPVLVSRNDYTSGLYNGDVGVVGCREANALEGHGDSGHLGVLFQRPEGGERWLSLRRIGLLETVFAMTVHKSQGSEFDEVLLVLPSDPSPVVTRELLYTAISRARRGVCLQASVGAIRTALGRRVERMSGLRDAIGLLA